MHESQSIESGNTQLFQQAPMAADSYMRQAVKCIDQLFGKGYAEKHPELVAAFIQTSAIDMGTAVIARAVESLKDPLNSIALSCG